MHSPALDNKPEYTPPSTPTGVPSKLTTTARIALAVLLTGELMNIVDDSVVVTAIPALQQSLGAGPAAVQWVTAGYALTFALALITGGRLGDIHGRRKMFLLGAFGFTLASLLCGLAADPGMLIAARTLQGTAAAVMIPQVLATLHATFTGAGRSRAFALYGAVLSLGSVAGPVLGGFLTEANLLGLSWRPIFLINVPVGIVVVLLGRKFIAETTTTEADRLDLIGVGLSATAMILILFPLTEGRTHGWPLWCWFMLAAGLLILGVFVRYLRHGQNPAGGSVVGPGQALPRWPVRAVDARTAVRAVLHDLGAVPAVGPGYEPGRVRLGVRVARARRTGRRDARGEDRRTFGPPPAADRRHRRAGRNHGLRTTDWLWRRFRTRAPVRPRACSIPRSNSAPRSVAR